MNQFFQIVGILTCTLLLFWIIARIILGKNWLLQLGIKVIAGPGLMQATQKLVREINEKEVQQSTLASVAVHIFWRLTRIGLVGLLIALLPIWLLMQQNSLIQSQNELFRFQNERIDQQTNLLASQDKRFATQNVLLKNQNTKIDTQTIYMNTQNELFAYQNTRVNRQIDLLTTQNTLLDTQNVRIKLQNNLIESQRRSSLVLLMNNILTDLSKEINDQKVLNSNGQASIDSLGYTLSTPLVGRIASLSKGLLPYRFLINGHLTEKEYSIERGQLLLALVNSNLNPKTMHAITQSTDFSNTYLPNQDFSNAYLLEINFQSAYLAGANFNGAHLEKANFKEAQLQNATFTGAHFEHIDFQYANLEEASLAKLDLSKALFDNNNLKGVSFFGATLTNRFLVNVDISYADFSGANLSYTQFHYSDLSHALLPLTYLKGTEFYGCNLTWVRFGSNPGLTANRLIGAQTLFKSFDLDFQIEKELKQRKPCLFIEEGCNVDTTIQPVYPQFHF